MQVPKWFVIARNEYRIRTSAIRKIRPYFLYLMMVFLAIYVGFIAPAIIKPFFEFFDFSAFFLSLAALAMIQITLFMFFIWFVFIPITYTLKEEQPEQLEIFLSAPIKPSDVLLGKFLGQLPLYGIAIVLITGIFTAILGPLGLDMLQIAMVIMVFILTLFSAEWIGTVIAALLKTRLSKTARGKDIGKALSLIIALPMVALMYAIMGGGLPEALADPNTSGAVKVLLGIFPSSWGAELIISFAQHPGNITDIWFGTLIRFGGLILFFIVSLWLGAKAANRAYSLESTHFSASTAKPNGTFYKTVKHLGGGKSFGTLLVSVFKDYGRRLENISKIAYIVGLLVLINIFFGDANDQLGALMMGMFIFPMLAAFVVGEVTLRGKEAIFIYRKAPSGVNRLIYARLIHGWLIATPIAVAIIVISLSMVSQITIVSILAYTGFIVVIVCANVTFALGISLLMPAFTEKESMVNMMIIMMASIFLFIPLLIIFGEVWGFVMFMPSIWLVGIVFLSLGKRKLSSIE